MILANLVFGFLVYLNLAYLGAVYNGDQSQTMGYNMKHTIEVWGRLGYVSHIIMAVVFGLATLI